jgi:hypothetical protein
MRDGTFDEDRSQVRYGNNLQDTVGEFKSAEMGVPHTPAWKAKTLGKLTQEKVLLEP